MNSVIHLKDAIGKSASPPDSAITSLITDALSEDRIELFYQPIVRADNGKFAGFYEGLARIRRTDGWTVPAMSFLPTVDNTHICVEIDCRTLTLAIRKLAENPFIRLSVNITGLTIDNRRWIELLEAAPEAICERLVIEITEGAFMANISAARTFIARVRKKGCSIALDDFGTGATSFRYFRDFSFDIVKLDGLFVRDIACNKDNQVLIKALTSICRHFDIMTVAEFIETPCDAEVARKLGVDCLQGHLIGKPNSETNFERQKVN